MYYCIVEKLTTTPRKINCFGTYTHMCTAIWAVKQSCEKQEDEFLASWQMVAGTIIHIENLLMETVDFSVNSYLCLRLVLIYLPVINLTMKYFCDGCTYKIFSKN